MKAAALLNANRVGVDPMRAISVPRGELVVADPRLEQAAADAERSSAARQLGVADATQGKSQGLGLDDLGKPPTQPTLADADTRGDRAAKILGDTPGGNPLAPEAGFDPLQSMVDKRAATQAAAADAARETLGAAGVSEGMGAGLGLGLGSSDAASSAIAGLTARGGQQGSGRADQPDITSFTNAAEARAGITGNDDGAGATPPPPPAKPAPPPANSNKPNPIVEGIKSAACAIIPGPVGSFACSALLSTTTVEDATNTANGIRGIYRSGATGTANEAEAKQLKALDDSKSRPSETDQGGGTITQEQWDAKRNGAVDPVDGEPGVDLEEAAARVGQGAALRILSTINPNPEGSAESGPVVIPESPLVDPVDPETPDGMPTPTVPSRPDTPPGTPGR